MGCHKIPAHHISLMSIRLAFKAFVTECFSWLAKLAAGPVSRSLSIPCNSPGGFSRKHREGFFREEPLDGFSQGNLQATCTAPSYLHSVTCTEPSARSCLRRATCTEPLAHQHARGKPNWNSIRIWSCFVRRQATSTAASVKIESFTIVQNVRASAADETQMCLGEGKTAFGDFVKPQRQVSEIFRNDIVKPHKP